MRSDNTFHERWPIIEVLLSLGWGIPQITSVIRWSPATIVKDAQNQGGLKRLFPSRPSGHREIYSTSFSWYVRNQHEDPKILEALGLLLKLPRIKAACVGMMGMLQTLARPQECDLALVPYVTLSLHLLNRNVPVQDDMFLSYQDDVGRRREASPTTWEEALSAITQRFVATINRREILGTPSLDGLIEFIDSWLETEDSISKQRASVIIRLYGLQGKSRRSDTDIAREDGCRHQNISALKKVTLESMRNQPNATELRRWFPDLEELSKREHLLEQKVADLEEALRLSMLEIPTLTIDTAPLEHHWKDLGLSFRSTTRLEEKGFENLGQLIQVPEWALLKIWSFGKTCLNELIQGLAEKDLKLGTTLPDHIARLFPIPEKMKPILEAGKRVHREKKRK